MQASSASHSYSRRRPPSSSRSSSSNGHRSQRGSGYRPQSQASQTRSKKIQNHTPPSSASQKTPTKKKSRYIPALDGLRAYAVLAVIAYHMNMPWAIGGLLGVTIFFVLSGYLITSLLVIEFQDSGRINLPQFWLRRIRRLFPAIVTCVFGVALLCTLFNHALLTKMRPDLIPSLLFYNNWWQIFSNVSYFDQVGAPSPLTHFWSLSIEEQFYLIWPPVLYLCLRHGVKRKGLAKGVTVAIIISFLLMAFLYDPAADPSRVYYGTDTRAFSLLIGALLAFLWPSNQLGDDSGHLLRTRERFILDGIGVIALIGLTLMIIYANGFTAFLYHGGILLCSLLTAVCIAVMVHPRSILGRIAGIKPLVWIGLRSYGMYLWHFPILLLTTDPNATELPWWMRLLQLALIFAVSELSYRFIENPIRHGAIGTFVKSVRLGEISLRSWIRRRRIPIIAVVAAFVVALGGLIFVPDTQAIGGANFIKQAEQEQGDATQANTQEGVSATSEEGYDIIVIGDSVLVRTEPYFKEEFPHGAIDAAVNRQFSAGIEVYDYYRDRNLVGDVVVFALGTNGLVTNNQIDKLMEDVGPDKQVWFITTRMPDSWMGATNAALKGAADRYENVHIIDWFAKSDGHPDYFDGDGTHLTEEAAQIYTDMIHTAVQDYLPSHADETE